MHVQGILAVAVSLFIGVNSLPQYVKSVFRAYQSVKDLTFHRAVTDNPSTANDTADSPNTVAAPPQQPVITAPSNGAHTGGFDGSRGEGYA